MPAWFTASFRRHHALALLVTSPLALALSGPAMDLRSNSTEYTTMKETKHSPEHDPLPSPWKAEHSGFGDAKVVSDGRWHNKDGTSWRPVIVNRIDWPTAKLIASAPSLLAENEKMKAWIESASEFLRDELRKSVSNDQADSIDALLSSLQS